MLRFAVFTKHDALQYIWESTKDESKNLDASFSSSKVTVKEKEVPHDTKKAQYETSTFTHSNFYDLYSGVLYIGSQPLNNGDKLNVLLFPFDKPYLAKVKVLGREKHLGHDCIKVELKLNKVNKDMTLKHYDKMKSATMWITDNADRIMVELRSEVFIGDVRCTLKSSEWN